MSEVETKDLGTRDEVRAFPNGRLEFFRVGGHTFAPANHQPGWHWRDDVGAATGDEWCPVSDELWVTIDYFARPTRPLDEKRVHPSMPSVRFIDLGTPDETRTFPNGKLELFTVGGIVMARTTFMPGWHWAQDVKPIAGTLSCQAHHVGIVLSGRLRVRTDDGQEYEIPSNSAYDIPPGHDGWVIGDEPWVTIDFIGMATFGEPSEDERVLLSILFTDIVDSTTIATRLGDVAWRELLARYNGESQLTLERYRAKTARDTGDGVLALFDNAARAINCALALGQLARTHGLEIRAGVHTGDVQVTDDDVRGVAVHEAARVMALAGPSEVLVSAATRALLAGNTQLSFESRGIHQLKGIEGDREIWSVAGPGSTGRSVS